MEDQDRKQRFEAEVKRVMRESQEKPEKDQLEIGVGTWWIRGKAKVLVPLAIGLGFLGLLYAHDKKMDDQTAVVNENARVMIYVISLTENERKALKLEMPESLRKWRDR